MATQPFIINFQDDMVVNELGYDIRLIKPALVWPDVMAVTSLAACDIVLEAGHIQWSGLTNFHNSLRTAFSIRDTINRGPLLLRHSMLETLGYLDEDYAPMVFDDVDLCMRAWKQYGWVAGVYPMPAFFKVEDGTSRQNANSAKVYRESSIKNEKLLIERHSDIINGPKHSENRFLEA
jgi:GT2 family glycosyltransferase